MKKITKQIISILSITFLFTSILFSQSKKPEIKAIKAGKLIDTETGRVLNNQIILIEGEKIKAVGADVKIPEGAKVIDLSNATVLPGLIDCHTHITGQSGNRVFGRGGYINPSVVAHLYLMPTLKAGFTSIRSLGSNSFDDVSLKRAIERGLLDGPRIQPASFYISSTGGHGDTSPRNPWVDSKRPPEYTGVADGVDEVRKKVRYLVKMGAGVIKMGASAGVLSVGDSVAAPQYSQEEMNAIVQEAHRLERKVTAHAHGTEAIKMAIKAGVDSIEHGSLIDNEGIRLMKENGVYLVADIYVSDFILSQGKKIGISEQSLAKERIVGKTQRENFQKAVKAGVKIAFGTDAGIFPHGLNARQFSFMTKWGMTPMQSIQAATINAADLFGWKDKVGSIKAEKYADIIAVENDPLKDVKVLENVSFVMKGGKVYKNLQK